MKMLLICVTLLMFTGSAVGLITFDPLCRFDLKSTCYGILGRPLYLKMFNEHKQEIRKIFSKTSDEGIFKVNDQTILQNHLDTRWHFVPENRTMIITRAEKEDSGLYLSLTIGLGGQLGGTGFFEFNVIIEAEVSSVNMMYSCLSGEKRRVHCYSDGDQIQFSWTLNGIPQNQNLTNGGQTLLMDEDFTGNITCWVENHVSSRNRTIELDRWKDLSALSQMRENGLMVFVLMWLFEVIFMVLLLVTAFYIYTRIYRKQIAAESKEQEGEEPL